MILIDFSQTVIAAVVVMKNEILRKDAADTKSLIKHIAINSIRAYKVMYGKKFGELVICVDSRDSWRKDYFPYYKANRKKSRDADELDWNIVFESISELKSEIQQYFPWKLVSVPKTEADDIIGVLCEYAQGNGLVSIGLVEEPQTMMIISSDHDFKQLQKWDNVHQFSPLQKKQVKVSTTELRHKVIEHIVKGDKGDGVPNIRSADNAIVAGDRQKPITEKYLQRFLDNGEAACETNEERRNWVRNKTLVDLSHTPEVYKKAIIETYLSCQPQKDKMKLMDYFIKQKMRLLMNDLQDF